MILRIAVKNATYSIMTISLMVLKDVILTCVLFMLCGISKPSMLSVSKQPIMLSAFNAECLEGIHYAECLYAKCRYAECHCAKCRGTK
jgi:hypothetical protein